MAISPQIHAAALTPDPRAHNLLVGRDVEIDETAEIGANVVIHDGVHIGPGARIKNNCVIGETPTLAPDSNHSVPHNHRTTIGAGVTICNGVVIFAGASIRERTIVGDQTHIREHTTIAEDCMIGRNCSINPWVTFGARSKVNSNSSIPPRMVVEEDVFIGGMVCAASDASMGRVPALAQTPVTLRRGCRIGTGSALMAGIEVGEEAVVGLGAVVLDDVPPRTKVAGVPARMIGFAEDHELKVTS
jgi:acetyltransferase-like isoleucine patch superfamily enzyme